MLGKLLSADTVSIKGNNITVLGDKFSYIDLTQDFPSVRDKEIFISSQWDESYEYDLISNLLPMIPERLYELLKIGYWGSSEIGRRGVTVQSFSNGICSLFRQDPTQINESMGLYSSDRTDNKVENKIYSFSRKVTNWGLSEINSHEAMYEQKRVNVLFVFISPRKLNEKEEGKLKGLLDRDPDYCTGVKEGWSILFTGMNEQNLVIKAGIQSRANMVKELTDSFWKEYKEHSFWFADGTVMKQL
ncbi:MAG: hypothetical protein HRU35_08180 [Rickettsiaceae bacterium]|nr:hypothetical protein [Rickettsiaceae bacterium]